MAPSSGLITVVILVTLTSFTAISSLLAENSSSTLLTCYTTKELRPSQIDSQLCTHILLIGACGLYKNATVQLPSDNLIRHYMKLKYKNIKLKLLLTLCPANGVMSRLVLSTDLRSRFIRDVIGFMKRNNLDGFDFDWEFPAWEPTGGSATDREGFAQLLKELREEIDLEEDRKYLLFVTVAAPYTIVDAAYDVTAINRYADYVQIMNYDFHVYSHTIPFTGFNAPLHAEDFEISVLARMNSDYSTQYWLRQGLKTSKLIFGIPTYGRGFRLSSPDVHGLYAPVVGSSSFGEFISYSTVCVILREGGSVVGREWRERAASPFFYMGTDWITYENEQSVRRKTIYALKMQAAGVMVYALQTDDFLGLCNETARRTFPLIRAIREEIKQCDYFKS